MRILDIAVPQISLQPRVSIPSSDDQTFLGIILISAAALVVVGILVVRWVKVTLSSRSRMDLAQRAPRRRNAVASRVANAAPDDDTRRALQKLLQVLEQPAPR